MMYGHQKAAQLAKGVAHRVVEARMLRDDTLSLRPEFGVIMRFKPNPGYSYPTKPL
jgi:hypothetical protein